MFQHALERLSFGWSMARSSWAAVRRHPRLLVFPLLSGLALAVLFASIFVPGGLVSAAGGIDRQEDGFARHDAIVLAWLAGYYFVLWTLMIFLNAALVFSTLRLFETGRVSLGEGLAMAASRLPQIIGWALIAATVGVLLGAITSALKDRLGFVGGLIGSLFETAWAVATYFVTPVLVVEGLGPIGAVRRSGQIVKATWGEAVGGEVGLGLVGALLVLPVILAVPIARLLELGPAGGPMLALLVAAYVIGVIALMATLSTVLRSALYVFAAKGEVPAGFEPGALASAFRPRG